jgi:hypothetical protein
MTAMLVTDTHRTVATPHGRIALASGRRRRVLGRVAAVALAATIQVVVMLGVTGMLTSPSESSGRIQAPAPVLAAPGRVANGYGSEAPGPWSAPVQMPAPEPAPAP